jgi:hypothetical protein
MTLEQQKARFLDLYVKICDYRLALISTEKQLLLRLRQSHVFRVQAAALEEIHALAR